MLNKILEHHMARVNALTHEVYAYIYIYILNIDDDYTT